jgi:nicotinamidase-related amidase
MSEFSIDAKTTALVAIDLQYGIVGLTTLPTPSKDLVARTAAIAEKLRGKGGLAIFVKVANYADNGDALTPETDTPAKPAGPKPANWSELVTELGVAETDIVITKRQWGAFFGTDLDLQLRRRGIKTIILTGIATNIGVESTARAAFEHGYNQIFVTDAMAALNEDGHRVPVATIFPRLGRIRSAEDVLAAIA